MKKFSPRTPNDPVIQGDGYAPVHEELAAIADAAPTPPPWLEDWRRTTRGRNDATTDLAQMAGPKEYLALWKAVRASWALPEDAAFYLVADEIRVLADRRHFDRDLVATFRARGEAEMADLLADYPEIFEARVRSGRDYFHRRLQERQQKGRRFETFEELFARLQEKFGRPGSSKGPALLRDVIENPADDAPRLIYAGWLDEHGDPDRAEFIRTQIELARLVVPGSQHPADGPRWFGLTMREHQLLDLHEDEWLASLPHVPGVSWASCFRRGFVEEAAVGGLGFSRRRCEEAFAAQPVRNILLDDPHQVGVLMPMPEASRLAGLTLFGTSFDKEWVDGLAAYPNLGGIATLSLQGCLVDGGEVAALLASPALKGLAELHLLDCPLGDEDVRQIANEPGLRRIRSLSLLSCGFGDAGALARIASPNAGGLRTLCLHDMSFSDRVWERLLARFPFVCIGDDD